jgi:hypothetical protein
MKKNLKTIFAAALMATSLLTGCVSRGPRCQFAVSNVGAMPLTQVALTVGDSLKYRSPSIPPKAIVNYRPLRPPVPRTALLAWVSPDGNTVSREVKIGKGVSKRFRGRVFFEVDEEQQVKVFVLPDLSEEGDPLPWGKPESWEGTVGIPGLSSQE